MDLLRALAIRRGQNAMLGEILVAHNVITHAQLIHALSTQYNIDVLDISGHEVPFELAQNFTAEDCFRLHFIPLSIRDDTITLALANPSHRDAIKKIVAGVGYRAEFVLDYRRTIQDKIAGAYREALLHKAKTICPAEFSCRDMLHPTRRRNFVICVALGMGFAGDGGYALADAVFHSYRHYDAEYLFEIALYHWLFYPRGTAKTRPARADSDSPTAFAQYFRAGAAVS